LASAVGFDTDRRADLPGVIEGKLYDACEIYFPELAV
jgi:hypothetical protein